MKDEYNLKNDAKMQKAQCTLAMKMYWAAEVASKSSNRVASR